MLSFPILPTSVDVMARTLWKPIPFAPQYEVSDSGVVRRRLPAGHRSYVGRILKPKFHHFGYPRIGLTIDGKKKNCELHILVLTAFYGPKPHPKAEGRHIDGNPANNHYLNLCWSSHRENEADKIVHGTAPRGERNAAAKLTTDTVRAIRAAYPDQGSMAQIGEKFGISPQHAFKIISRRLWPHV